MALVAAIILAALVVPSPWGIPLVCGAIVLEVGEAWFWWRLSHRGRPSVGVETLVGAKATVVVPCRPRGQVRVGGELWQARCGTGADPGDVVDVVAVDGLELVVGRR
jgi:membrane-bound serine protease (ClpP class)